MKSSFQQRIARLESAGLRQSARLSRPVNAQSFQEQVKLRMRQRGESLETATQALLVLLEDEELEAIMVEAGIPPHDDDPE